MRTMNFVRVIHLMHILAPVFLEGFFCCGCIYLFFCKALGYRYLGTNPKEDGGGGAFDLLSCSHNIDSVISLTGKDHVHHLFCSLLSTTVLKARVVQGAGEMAEVSFTLKAAALVTTTSDIDADVDDDDDDD